jgi:hypothetical protein
MPLGHDPFTIGYHEKALDMAIGIPDNADPKANLDAALFKIADDARVTSYQGSTYDTPTATQPLQPGMKVEKVGRSTGHTEGTVVGQWYGALGVLYEVHIHDFRGRVYFDPAFAVTGKGSLFADAGDSGALVTTVDQAGVRYAVGIVVGGMRDSAAAGGQIAFILPIEPILQKLSVTLVDGHNV